MTTIRSTTHPLDPPEGPMSVDRRPASPSRRDRHGRIVRHARHVRREDGSLVTEYGLLAVVAATVAGVVIQWASSGTLVNLFNALIARARDIVGA
jgi:Flp pilus assembly pilin Flp